jgi:NAD(P)H-hydrate epimerase
MVDNNFIGVKSTRSLTRAEVRELDRRAIEYYGIPGVVLMENAGRAVAEEAVKMLPTKDTKRVALFCGKGNNGGDGFVAARHLNNHGVEVEVYLLCKSEEVASSLDAYTHLGIIQKMGLPVREVITPKEVKEILPRLKGSDLLIDALLGTGLTGNVREPYKTLIKGLNSLGSPMLSVDIPSGLDCDEGLPLGVAVKATKTVTFILPKVGFFKNQGPAYVGELVVADIGIPKQGVGG